MDLPSGVIKKNGTWKSGNFSMEVSQWEIESINSGISQLAMFDDTRGYIDFLRRLS
jgi:hypothetical protein